MKVSDQTIRVTPHVRHLELELEKAVALVADAETREEINEVWPRLSAAREALYRYVEGLEKHAGVDRECQLRF